MDGSHAGNVFIVHGDITQCDANAVIFSTSTTLDGNGDLHSAFSSWAGFAPWYAELGRAPHGKIGDTDWLPAGANTPGIVLLRSVGTHDPRDPEQQVATILEKALARADSEVRRSTDGPYLILVPGLLLGQGGGHDRRLAVARRAIETAHAFVHNRPDIDVGFVLYTPSTYALYRHARRSLDRAPQVPALESAPELVASVAAGECVVFIGSGVSSASGMPGWTDLIRRLAEHAGIACTKDLPYEEKLQIAEVYRERAKAGAVPDVPTVVHEVFGTVRRPVLTHYLLAQLDSRFLFTTNYDRLLETTLHAVKRPWRRVTHAHDVPATSQAAITQVVKLHGDAASPSDRTDDGYQDVVLSTEDYEQFSIKRAAFDLLLGGLMLNHTFLFVGYSVSDENVKATWSRILGAINGRASDAGRHRRAYGLGFDGSEKSITGLEWIVNPGTSIASRSRAQWRLLDALAEHVTEPSQMLAPDEIPDPRLAHIGGRLNQAAAAVTETLNRPTKLPATETKTLSRIAELLYELGWKPATNARSLWEQLADAASDRPAEQRALLELALAHSHSSGDAERLRERLRST